ncbi:glycoside hydrolase family 9 protein [Maribellus sediminis]|uniref:glycoside hydrolase family 9 protein n=1 Tax=Maribellus sediminis TaxID=2696285 RepID=UPI00142FA6DB|nr:glycoside hydrolase family 9 protein [Maribellus sediminis]
MPNLKPVTYLFIVLLFVQYACSDSAIEKQKISEDILINQIGYPTAAQKLALLRIDADEFAIKNSEQETVFTGKTGAWKYWKLSGDSVRVADFSEFKAPGEYTICVNDSLCSYPFKIENEVYNNLADAVLKSYYYARCGVDIDSTYGGKWHWKAGHPDTQVMIHASAADNNRPEGTIISSPGGWYDAGDYGKYVVNSGISTYTLLLSCELNKKFHQTQNLNIPESGNELPDILDEALVNLKWMMTMQDPNDGGVYHKLTTKNFTGFVAPSETSEQRYVVQKSTAAALDFAATMAHASRLVAKYGMDELSAEMKQGAEKAWIWALRNPDVLYKQPADVSTGAYGDRSLTDEWYWAAAELYLNDTHNRSYLDAMLDHWKKPETPTWNSVNTLGVISLLTSDEREKFPAVEAGFLAHVDQLLAKEKQAPYSVSINKFAWGSNSDVANDGMLKLIAWQLTRDEKYVASAQNDLDYILGRNATGFSFVTGFGPKSTRNPHNRIMSSDGVDDPIPGYLAGGPNLAVLTDCDPKEVKRSPYPAASYVDVECSYSTNETAINWNAPLVFLVSGLDYFYVK